MALSWNDETEIDEGDDLEEEEQLNMRKVKKMIMKILY
ncbi:hypothetical protein UACE39S_02979 [Ureibacillus acetophenoni]